MNRRFIVPFFSVLFYFFIYALIVLLKPPSHDHIRQMHVATSDSLGHLAQLQEFRSIPIEANWRQAGTNRDDSTETVNLL